jgi:hypothetical protein
MNNRKGSIELNSLLLIIVFVALCKINREYYSKLDVSQKHLIADLKNKHLIPRDQIAKAFFDDNEVLWILVTDKEGKEILKRADGKPNNTLEDDYEYKYIRDANQYPI